MNEAAVWQVWGPLSTIAVILLIRARRIGRERPLRIRFMWIVPALVILVVGILFFSMPPPPIGWAALVVGLAAGAALGWRRGQMMALRVDCETGTLWQTQSVASFMVVLAIIGLRLLVKDVFGGDPTQPHFVPWAVAVTDLLMGVALGVIVFTRVEMYLRARQLLAWERGS